MPNKTLQHVNYNGTTYDIDAVTVNGHTVQSDVPASYNWDKSKVTVSDATASGNKVAVISIDGTDTTLYSPKYTGTSPISISGTAISHANSGATAGTYGVLATTALNPDFGDSFSIPGLTIDAKGHVTAAGAHNVNLPGISFTRSLTSGTKVGTLTINGTDTDLYAPTNTNTWNQYGGATTSSAGTAGYVPGAVANQLYQYFAGNGTWRGAPAAENELGLFSYEEKTKLAGIASGATATSITQTKTSGKQLATLTINGTDTNIYDDRDIWYATCPTAAGTATKVVTTTNSDFRLETGATIFIKFTYANTSTSATLNVDGKGAKSIKAYGTTAPTASTWAAGAVVRFTYDGTNFIQENGQIASTSVYGITKLSSATNSTSTTLAATASAVKSAYDLAAGKSIVTYSQTVASSNGNAIGTITIDGTDTVLYSQKYTGTAPISIDSNFAITHATSGPSSTADTSKGDTTAQSPGFGGTFKALSATVNKYGHTTSLAEHNVTLPGLTNTPAYNSGILVDTITIDGTDSKIYIPSYPTVESLGLNKVLKFIGFSSTSMSDGQTSAPTISGITSYTPAVGDVVIDGHDSTATSQYEYVYTSANKWERLGGDDLYVISGTQYDVTNGGTNANSAVTISPKTTNVYSMTSAGSVTSGASAVFSMDVTNEKLTYTFETNTPTEVTLPGRSSAIAAWTGYNTGVANTYAAGQTFTPTTKTIQVN